MSRTKLFGLLVLLLSPCASQASPKASIEWAGTYTASNIERVDSPDSVTGKLTVSSAKHLEKRGTRIDAALGTRFGMAFKFADQNSTQPVSYEEVWHFPQPGLTNPHTKRTMTSEKYSLVCQVNASCVAGRVFSEPWELRSGTWAVEILVGNKPVLRQTFEITVR